MNNEHESLSPNTELNSFEKKIMVNIGSRELVESAVRDIKSAITKLFSANDPSDSILLDKIAYLVNVKNELEDNLDEVKRILELANEPTELEKAAGITEWGRIKNV